MMKGAKFCHRTKKKNKRERKRETKIVTDGLWFITQMDPRD